MADFRKWLYAFAVVALLAGLTVPASAQVSSFQTCVGGAVNPTVRAEGYTELAGDITITCSGGTLTSLGNAVPAVTIDVQMNVPITSKITSNAFNPAFNEALLLIDEPGLGAAGNALLNCGDTTPTAPGLTGAPFDPTAGAGVCTVHADANGSGATIYNGTDGHPNVFQGRQVNNSNNQIIQFIGVPLDGGSHTLRIVNLRANVVFQTGGPLPSNFNSSLFLSSLVTFTSPNSVNAQLINVNNGAIRNGLTSVTGTSAGPYLQCTFTTAQTVVGGSVTLLEGFPSAWKVRNWRQINDNGSYLGTADWKYSLGYQVYNTADMVQNVPNAFYSTESGFMYPPAAIAAVPVINPPQGISNATGTPVSDSPFTSGAGDPTGISRAGTVTNGTRFAINFAGIPAGTTITVPGYIPLINQSGGGGNTTGAMLAVGNTDANGAGGTVGTGGTITNNVNFTVIYEVVFDDPLAIESATIPVTANVTAFNGSAGTPQVNQIATATAGFAPFYSNGAGSVAGCPLTLGSPLTGSCVTGVGPIPRFISAVFPTPPVNLFSFNRCACDMLFPWVVGDNTFYTSIVVANTSLDPGSSFGFVASPQSGLVRFWFYGTTDVVFNPSTFPVGGPGTVTPMQVTTASVPPGSYVAFVVAPSTNPSAGANASAQTAGNGLKPIAGNFAGYVIAQSDFQYCHGIASIAAPGLSPQTYLGLVLDKGFRGGYNNSLPSLITGQELPRTNQAFADELEN